MPIRKIESPYGGGVWSLPGAAGKLLPVKFPTAPVLLADGPQLGSWRVAVVRVDETPAGDASGQDSATSEVAVGGCWKCSSSVAGWGSSPPPLAGLVRACGSDTG